MKNLLLVAALCGCTAGVKPATTANGGSSAAGVAGSTGSGGGGNVITGAAGNTGAGGTTGTSGSSGFDASLPDARVCEVTTTKAEPLPLDLYVMVDLSRTMMRATSSGSSKWDAVRSAMKTFFSDPQSAGLGAGIGYFPAVQPNIPPTCTEDMACGAFGPCDRRKTCVQAGGTTNVVVPLCVDNSSCAAGQACALIQDCGEPNFCAADGAGRCAANCTTFPGYCHARDVCDPQVYATPVVPIAALSGSGTGQAATLAASLDQRMPDGYTTTAPALKGAIQYARQYAQTNVGHKLAVVLVTDGLPLGFTDVFDTGTGVIDPGIPRAECDPIDIPGIAAIAAGGATPPAGMPSVPTFVIGVSSTAESAVIGPMLNQIATGGRTAPAILIDTSQDVSQILRAKLAEIRTKAIACEFKLPTSGVDFKKVNVTFTGGAGTTTIGHAPIDGTNGSGCDARGGWYYDKDPTTGMPTKITACPTTCSMFQTDLAGRVDVVLGCPTVDIG
jgi:hypothetical protein